MDVLEYLWEKSCGECKGAFCPDVRQDAQLCFSLRVLRRRETSV